MANELMQSNQAAHSAMVEVQSSRQVQEVQAAMLIAKRFPRDMIQAHKRIIDACSRKSLAERAMYAYPRGGQTVTGPSIRMAEAIAQVWGNLDFGIVELDKKPAMGGFPGESVMMAYCYDLETNSRSTKVFTVKHKRDTKKGSMNLNDERDIYELVANNGARRLRSCILSIIPGDVVESAIERCEQTLQHDQEPIVDRIKKMVVAFADLGVNQEMLEKRLAHKMDVTTETELVGLRKIYTSIKDGFGVREDFFSLGNEEPAADNAKDAKTVEPQHSAEIKTLRSVKNHAPQSQAEAEERAKSAAPQSNGNQNPAPQAGPTREELIFEIKSLAARLGLNPKQTAQKIRDLVKKDPNACSTEELASVVDILTVEEMNGKSGN